MRFKQIIWTNLFYVGSQVIEQERQRVLALKQKVQEEVKIQWAQQRQDSIISSDSDGVRNRYELYMIFIKIKNQQKTKYRNVHKT